jgi:hypothetical protein
MSGHLQSCFAAFLLTGLSISPASSNPFTDLFSFRSRETTAPVPAQEECLSQPGKLAADGQHWVYRLEGHRKCWFQTAGGVVASVKKRVHHYAVKQRVTALARREAALRKRKADVDARAELRRSAPVEMSQPTLSARELKMTDAAAVPVMGAAPPVQPALVAESATDQLPPDRPAPRLVDVETLRVSPSASDTIGFSGHPAMPIAEAGDDGRGWTATWIGVLLMALGLVSILSSGLPMLLGLLSRLTKIDQTGAKMKGAAN